MWPRPMPVVMHRIGADSQCQREADKQVGEYFSARTCPRLILGLDMRSFAVLNVRFVRRYQTS